MPAIDDAATGWFSRHIVTLEMTYMVRHRNRPPEVARCYYTGFLLYERQATMWVTAGHCMEEIEKDILGHPESYSDVKFRFVDTLHSEAISNEPVPFDYQAEYIKTYYFHRDDEGVERGWDFGVVFLRTHYARLLAANGIEPVSAQNWVKVPDEFDRYFMLGLPGERVGKLENGDYTARPAMFSITRLASKPDCFSYQTDPMIYAQIDSEADVENIKGMSGGPIIGVKREGEAARYWIIGIQSKWRESERKTAASPLADLRNILVAIMDKAMADLNSEKPTPSG